MSVVRHVLQMLAVLVGLVVAPTAWACSCIQSEPDEFAARMSLLFEGSLLRNEAVPPSTETTALEKFGKTVEGVFKVHEVYKGQLGALVRIRYWPATGGNCGTYFVPNTKVTIAAYGDPVSGYVTNMCVRVNHEPFRTHVLEAARRLREPLNANPQPD